MSNNAPDTTDKNPFSLLAYVLFKVRHAIEDYEDADRPPKWIRIARGAEYKEEPLGSIVNTAVNGMGETISYMVELTLDLEELLYQTDAAKAIAEVMLRMIQAATDENFQNGIKTLVGADSLGDLASVMDTINSASTQVEEYLDYIPEPEDVRGLGHELYRMLCIVQKDFPRNAADNSIKIDDPDLKGTDHLVQEDSGKVRLMSWSYAHGITSRGLGPKEENEKELFRLGSRRLFQTAGNADLPQRTMMEWISGEDKVEVYNMNYDASSPDSDGNEDIVELVQILKAHDYNDPAMTESETTITGEIEKNLMKFQAINELPITGEIDNETINRLMNLDYSRKNVQRAKPFDANFQWPWGTDEPLSLSNKLMLVNPGAEDWEDEGLTLVQSTPHPYYLIPVTPADGQPADPANWPLGQGWIRDGSTATTPAFVALRSRFRNLDDTKPGRFVGGKFSEGEAASGGGRYFFAARHTEPWKDARTGDPGEEALFKTKPAKDSISRMYQWIPLPVWLKSGTAIKPNDTDEWELYFYATVLQRSLFTDRGGKGFPDQGRIILELYGSDVYNKGTVSVRDAKLAQDSSRTDYFPDHKVTTAALKIEEVDRKRMWTTRATIPFKSQETSEALCLVAEGLWQSAWDIDAYFDDFCIQFFWKKV